MRHQARTDFLTGLANRFGLSEFSRRTLQDSTADRFAVLQIDLDGFKSLNDTFGHRAGDEVLRRLSNAFGQKLRSHDFVARVGGDEFVVVLVGSGFKEAQEVADRLKSCPKEQFSDMRLTLSIGIALYPEDGDSMDAVIKTADERMYIDKKCAAARQPTVEYHPD